MKHKTLSVKDILVQDKTSLFEWNTTKNLQKKENSFLPQERIYNAISMAINTKGSLYNALLTTSQKIDLDEIERFVLSQIEKPYSIIKDIILLNNFKNPLEVISVSLAKGTGTRLKKSIYTALQKIEKEKNSLYKNTKTSSKLDSLFKVREILNEEIKNIAQDNNFNISIHNETDELVISSINDTNASEKEKITLMERISGELKKLKQINESIKEERNTPQRKKLKEVIEKNINYVKKTYRDKENILKQYFEDMKEDLLNNQYFLQNHLSNISYDNSWMERYQINIFIDNEKQTKLPFIKEERPTLSNLLGYRKKNSTVGITAGYNPAKEFVAGALHKAIGGVLLLDISDLLRYPQTLKLFLEKIYSKEYSINHSTYLEEAYSQNSISMSLKNCNTKILLIAKEKQYSFLENTEDYFLDIFPIQAQFISSIKKTQEKILLLLQYFLRIIEKYELLHFDKEAILVLLQYGSKLVHNQHKLSLDTQEYTNIMRESSTIAELHGSYLVQDKHVQEAIDKRRFRTNLIEDNFMEEYHTNLLHLKTSGKSIAIINALGIIEYHKFTLGVIHKISCAVGRTNSSSENIINIEKAVNMAGEIHSKATLIIQSYLTQMFAEDKGLKLQAYYYFEQAYSKIEGDSASCAELIALLSALAEVPLSQEIAISGAVSQYGDILPVGGIDIKIEGFFQLCKSNGLTKKQGVIIPQDNIANLTLNRNVLDAIEKEEFFIYPVSRIEEAIEILTELEAGKKDKDGNFKKDTFLYKVNTKLKELSSL